MSTQPSPFVKPSSSDTIAAAPAAAPAPAAPPCPWGEDIEPECRAHERCPRFKIEINRVRPVSEGATWWATTEGTPGQELWFKALDRHAATLTSENHGPTITVSLIDAAAFFSEAAQIDGWSDALSTCPFVVTRLEDGEHVRPEMGTAWIMGYLVTPQWVMGDEPQASLDADEVCDDYEAPTDDDGAPAPLAFYAWGPLGIGYLVFASPAESSEALQVQRGALDDLGLLPLEDRDTVAMAAAMEEAEAAIAPPPRPSPTPSVKASL